MFMISDKSYEHNRLCDDELIKPSIRLNRRKSLQKWLKNSDSNKGHIKFN